MEGCQEVRANGEVIMAYLGERSAEVRYDDRRRCLDICERVVLLEIEKSAFYGEAQALNLFL
jgi:hypothetical protein